MLADFFAEQQRINAEKAMKASVPCAIALKNTAAPPTAQQLDRFSENDIRDLNTAINRGMTEHATKKPRPYDFQLVPLGRRSEVRYFETAGEINLSDQTDGTPPVRVFITISKEEARKLIVAYRSTQQAPQY